MQNLAVVASAVRPVITSVYSKNQTGVNAPQSILLLSVRDTNHSFPLSRKHEVLTRSLQRMEQRLDTVLRSIGNPSIASGMVSRSPSPSARAQTTTTSALLASPSPPPPESPSFRDAPLGSPKLHSLPDNALNPLGLLAEASLANRRLKGNPSPLMARTDKPENIGVASDNYFKPGMIIISFYPSPLDR